ncbi:MAG TPA: hypothetical protein PKC19_17345, partial [Roseiflexaceae bacterium]|nr:hypothetical protein [Roseiflexaceae bacterium]
MVPPAIAAVFNNRWLRQQAGSILEAQQRSIERILRDSRPRPEVLAALDQHIRQAAGGVLRVLAEPGAGTTTLLCQLVATRRYPCWFGEPAGDVASGRIGLAAQLLALHDTHLPLVPPAVAGDSLQFEQVLTDAAEAYTPDDPLVVVIDAPAVDRMPWPGWQFPHLPPNITLIYAGPAVVPHATELFHMPQQGPIHEQLLQQIASAAGLGAAESHQIMLQSGGSLLYARQAALLVRSGLLSAAMLPERLGGLHAWWWQQLDAAQQQLAAVIAAAAVPLPSELLAAITDQPPSSVQDFAARWSAFLISTEQGIGSEHHASANAIGMFACDALKAAHRAIVDFIYRVADGQPERSGWYGEANLASQLARQLALAQIEPPAGVPAGRAWVM